MNYNECDLPALPPNISEQLSWNNLSLPHPPYVNCVYTTEEYKQLLERIRAVGELETVFIAPCSELKTLILEDTLLNRIKFKESMRLKRNKVMQFIHRINRSVRNFKILDLENESQKLTEKIMNVQENRSPHDSISFPSREVIEHLLVKTMSFVRLAGQLVSYCQNAFSYCMQYLRVGHLIPTYLTSTVLIARIWALSKGIMFKIHDWYVKIREVSFLLKSTGINWIMSDVWNDLLLPNILSSLPDDCNIVDAKTTSLLNSVPENCRETIEKAMYEAAKNDLCNKISVDFGEIISRESFNGTESLKTSEDKPSRKKRKLEEEKIQNELHEVQEFQSLNSTEECDITIRKQKKKKLNVKKGKPNQKKKKSFENNRQDPDEVQVLQSLNSTEECDVAIKKQKKKKLNVIKRKSNQKKKKSFENNHQDPDDIISRESFNAIQGMKTAADKPNRKRKLKKENMQKEFHEVQETHSLNSTEECDVTIKKQKKKKLNMKRKKANQKKEKSFENSHQNPEGIVSKIPNLKQECAINEVQANRPEKLELKNEKHKAKKKRTKNFKNKQKHAGKMTKVGKIMKKKKKRPDILNMYM